MKVLFLVGSLGAGGLERYVTRVVSRAKRGGEFTPVVCCLVSRSGKFLPDVESAGVQVLAAKGKWWRQRGAFNDLARLIASVKPDIVHSQVNFSILQQSLAVRKAGKVPLCITERSCYRRMGIRRVRRVLQFYGIRLLGGSYSANSDAVALHLAQQVFTDVSSIPVVPNGIDPIDSCTVTRGAMRARLGWAAEEVGIGYVGRMAPDKGHELFLRAVKNLVSRGNLHVRVALLGDGPLRGKFEQIVEDMQLGHLIRFHGVVPNVDDYLQAFDVVTLSSSREGMPNSVLEAMAASKAVVATDVGAIPDLLDGGKAGVLVPRDNVDELAKGLASVISNGKLRYDLGQAAARRVESLFSFERAYARLLHYYAEVIGK